jgi:hypothetical protein
MNGGNDSGGTGRVGAPDEPGRGAPRPGAGDCEVTGSVAASRYGEKVGEHAALGGAVAGAVLRAARLSAGSSEMLLATAAGVEEAAVRAWEDGTDPLASVPVPQVGRLKAALRAAGAEPRLVADLDAATWCDLVILAITAGEDAVCLLADPLVREEAFADLLTWSLAGRVPARYRPYYTPGPLVPDGDLALVAAALRTAAPC